MRLGSLKPAMAGRGVLEQFGVADPALADDERGDRLDPLRVGEPHNVREIELAIDELKTHQRGPRTVPRSKSPDLPCRIGTASSGCLDDQVERDDSGNGQPPWRLRHGVRGCSDRRWTSSLWFSC